MVNAMSEHDQFIDHQVSSVYSRKKVWQLVHLQLQQEQGKKLQRRVRDRCHEAKIETRMKRGGLHQAFPSCWQRQRFTICSKCDTFFSRYSEIFGGTIPYDGVKDMPTLTNIMTIKYKCVVWEIWKDANLWCVLQMLQKSVLHDLQKVPASGHAERASVVMQNRHHQGTAELPVMLGPAFQTWWTLEKPHDKSRNLPDDPDTFALDNDRAETTTVHTGSHRNPGSKDADRPTLRKNVPTPEL